MDESNGYFDNLSGTEPQRNTSPQNVSQAPQPVWSPVPPDKHAPGAYPLRVSAPFRGQKPAVCGHSRTAPGFLL